MTVLQELAKYNRKAALIYQREIRLLIKRGKIPTSVYDYDVDCAATLIDRFRWRSSRQGGDFWAGVYTDMLLIQTLCPAQMP